MGIDLHLVQAQHVPREHEPPAPRTSQRRTQDGRIGRMSEHHEHQAGTMDGCWHCTKVAYEPSWYASLLAFSQVPSMAEVGRAQLVSS
jgi:hypothetical protein